MRYSSVNFSCKSCLNAALPPPPAASTCSPQCNICSSTVPIYRKHRWQQSTSSFEAVTRADYAEPLRLHGNANLSFHWDATNGARNNRFMAASSPGPGDNL